MFIVSPSQQSPQLDNNKNDKQVSNITSIINLNQCQLLSGKQYYNLATFISKVLTQRTISYSIVFHRYALVLQLFLEK